MRSPKTALETALWHFWSREADQDAVAQPGVFTVGSTAGPELKVRKGSGAAQRAWGWGAGRWRETCTLLCLSRVC